MRGKDSFEKESSPRAPLSENLLAPAHAPERVFFWGWLVGEIEPDGGSISR